jgi:hypothetical protein
MTNHGFEPRSQGRFEATVENEIKHLWKQIDLLWAHNTKRRLEIEAAKDGLTKQVDQITSRINGAIYAFAVAAAGAVVVLLKPKLGL